MPFLLRKLFVVVAVVVDALVFSNLLNFLQKIFFPKMFVFVCELPATPAPIRGQFRDFGFNPLFRPGNLISVRNFVGCAIALKRNFAKKEILNFFSPQNFFIFFIFLADSVTKGRPRGKTL